MTNKQYKNKFLVSKTNEALHNAAMRLDQGAQTMALYWLNVALSFARQLPDMPKHRAIRAYIITAREALQ